MTMAQISPMAAIDPQARIGNDVEIGPFCVVGPHVTLGDGCRLINNVTVLGHTTLGKGNILYPQAIVGAAPQDKKFHGEVTYLEIGNGNSIRECVTIHPGTGNGGGVTRIGHNNLLMVSCHIGHDVTMGSNCIVGNVALIAGHVHIANNVAIMAAAGIHAFVTLGDYSYIGGYSHIHHDVPPFVKADGSNRIRGCNKEGLKRAKFDPVDIEAVEEACRALFLREKPLAIAMTELAADPELNPFVKQLLSFLQRRDQGKNGRYLEALRVK
jgi:UDP-N-acetylglucosamine acyltransferase